MFNRKIRFGIGQLAVVGAIFATLGDANHVYTHTLKYPDPHWFGQSAWVFPGFVVAFLLMGFVYAGAPRVLSSKITMSASFHPGSPRLFIENIVMFFVVYLLSGYGNHDPARLTVIFYGTFVLRWLFTYERGFIMIFALLLAFGGMFGEGLMTQVNLVHYRQPEIFGVPYWLGGLYMHGAFALREGMRLFAYKL